MQHRSRKLPAAAIDVCAALLVDACGNATSIAFDSSEDHSLESARDLFEILVVRGIRTYLSVMPGAANKNGYYHDEKGVEADIVVELSDGRWAAIEVKLSENMVDEDAAARLLHVAS